MQRRAFLASSVSFLALLGVGCGGRDEPDDSADDPWLDTGITPYEGRDPLPGIVSNDAFYNVSFNPSGIPEDDWLDGWTLTVGGTAESSSVELTLADLQAIGGDEVLHTLQCIGSNPANLAIGNARWVGITLLQLLEHLGRTIPEEAVAIRMTGGDDYRTDVPIDELLTGIRLVWEMNGEPLPRDHGAPLRVLCPGRYGMKGPKWLTSIVFVDSYADGFWETLGWSDEARVGIHSWIHELPQASFIGSSGADIVGSAYAGSVPIARVEFSDDDGVTWQDAEMTYAGGPNEWSTWRMAWVPTRLGDHSLTVRAIDESGRVQQDLEATDAGLDGFDGFHRVLVAVVD